MEDLRRTVESEGAYFRYKCNGELDAEAAREGQLLAEEYLTAWLDNQPAEVTYERTQDDSEQMNSTMHSLSHFRLEDSDLQCVVKEKQMPPKTAPCDRERLTSTKNPSSVGIIFLGDLNSTPETAAIRYIKRYYSSADY